MAVPEYSVVGPDNDGCYFVKITNAYDPKSLLGPFFFQDYAREAARDYINSQRRDVNRRIPL